MADRSRRHATQHAAALIIFLAIAQAEEGIGHIEPLRVVTEEIGLGAAAGVAAGALGAWGLRTFGSRGWMEGTWKHRRGGDPAAEASIWSD